MHIKSKNSWLKHFDFLLIDIIALFISFVIANMLYLHRLSYYGFEIYRNVFLAMLVPQMFICLLYMPYSGILRRNNVAEATNLITYAAIYFITAIVTLYVFKLSSIFSRVVFVLTYILYLIIGYILRIIWKKLLISGKVLTKGFERNSLLIVSEYKNINKILDNINKEEFIQYDIKGLCILDEDLKDNMIGKYPILCNKSDIYDCVMDNYVNEVFLACKPDLIDSSIISGLINEGIGIQLDINSIYNIEPDDEYIDRVGIYKTLGLGLYTFTPRQSLYLLIKRFFDIIISLFAFLFLGIIAIGVKIAYLLNGDTYPIFYTQERVGQNGKVFKLFKFRTMVPNAQEILQELLKDEDNQNEWNNYHKFKNDPRITKVGRILRKTSLDEFPQFINVLKGDMSIIGPRPLVVGELKMHNGLRLYERIRPGITGWWACNGRSNMTYEERLEHEYYYVKNCSLFLDILTFIRTIICVFRKTGAE